MLYLKSLYSTNLEYLKEMVKSLDSYNLPKLGQGDIN